MLTRKDVLSHAATECMKELYSLVQPRIDWREFKKECKIYSNKYKAWERFHKLCNRREDLSEEELREYSTYSSKWIGKSVKECIGPRPYEFYYLPSDITKNIVLSYVTAYRMDHQQELLDTIEILKKYCKEPIVDKYIKGENGFPGHRGYEQPDNLHAELTTLIKMYCNDSEADFSEVAKEIQSKFFEFLDMAGKFYNWTSEINAFSLEVFLGPSPDSNKQAVIDNWKIYKKQNIIIDDNKYDEYIEE